MNEGMTFEDICKELGITEYASAIFSSNSHGELMHLCDYTSFLELHRKHQWFRDIFPDWFKLTVEWAEKNWERPASIYQHMYKLFVDYCEHVSNNENKGETQ